MPTPDYLRNGQIPGPLALPPPLDGGQVGPPLETGPTQPMAQAQLEPWTYGISWRALVESSESVPELTWPASNWVYERMRNDAQIGGLLRGSLAPTFRYRWFVDPEDTDPAVAARLADDLGLPLKVGTETKILRSRNRNKFQFMRHLHMVYLGLVFGHMFFDKVGAANQEGSRWMLLQLLPVMPKTIQDISVTNLGELAWIKQWGAQSQPIPSSHLASYVWQREGANWVGRSWLRELYQSWLLKDDLVRVDVLKHRRNGMGMPMVTTPPNATSDQRDYAAALAQAYKAGSASGGALPAGFEFELHGVKGTLPDTVGSMRYHDEQMARNLMMMFVQLGQTQHGSRALGETFVDFFALGVEAIAGWARDTSNEELVEDWYDWNVGQDTPTAKIGFDILDDPQMSTQDLVMAVEGGLIHMDAQMEMWLRERYRMPSADPAELEALFKHEQEMRDAAAVPTGNGIPSGVPQPGGNVSNQLPPGKKVAATVTRVRQSGPAAYVRDASAPAEWSPRRLRASVGGYRDYRRKFYDHEIKAGVDFAALDDSWTRHTTAAVQGFANGVRPEQIRALTVQIQNAKTLEDLAAIVAPVDGALEIEKTLQAAAQDGVWSAVDEAASQGKKLAEPGDWGSALLQHRSKSIAEILANSISQTAAQRAIQLTGQNADMNVVARRVKEHLEGLSDRYLFDQLGGAITAAQNQGRESVFRTGTPAQIYASEILDTNTCENCIAVDGRTYATLQDATHDYPNGGYVDCKGGQRCRGIYLAVWDD